MNGRPLDRRRFLRLTAAAAVASGCERTAIAAAGRAESALRLATFSADVTVPVGHPVLGGNMAAAKTIADPLLARGLVLLGPAPPVVIVAVDWCEIRNDAYDRWRAVLAEAAGTKPERVLLTSTHVHDAPVADLEAQRLLDRHAPGVKLIDLEFHEQAVQRVAAALRRGLTEARPVTHLGLGQAQVNQIASNRRYLAEDGTPRFNRMSATREDAIRARPEGTIDPWLKTISFWRGGTPLAALSSYATHPMSYYGRGEVSADFIGMARARRQADEPDVFQIYGSGCSGNVTAGKYNDGSTENRAALAGRLHQAMSDAWRNTRRVPLRPAAFRSVPLRLEPRATPGFTEADLMKALAEKSATPFTPFAKCKAAMGLSWRKRVAAGRPIDVPGVDFGDARLLLLPAEAYVEYQLFAQEQRPDSFVQVLGYGECAPGYIPIDRAWAEGDTNLRDWCWVAPGAEQEMKTAIEAVLRG
jgi:hypothetical protein